MKKVCLVVLFGMVVGMVSFANAEVKKTTVVTPDVIIETTVPFVGSAKIGKPGENFHYWPKFLWEETSFQTAFTQVKVAVPRWGKIEIKNHDDSAPINPADIRNDYTAMITKLMQENPCASFTITQDTIYYNPDACKP